MRVFNKLSLAEKKNKYRYYEFCGRAVGRERFWAKYAPVRGLNVDGGSFALRNGNEFVNCLVRIFVFFLGTFGLPLKIVDNSFIRIRIVARTFLCRFRCSTLPICFFSIDKNEVRENRSPLLTRFYCLLPFGRRKFA